MNLDKYGLPIQSDGDAADQLQRVGMLAVLQKIAGKGIISTNLDFALKWMLQLQAGEYRRYYETIITNDVTGDQLMPTIAYWTLIQNNHELRNMPHIFARNTRKQGEPNVKTFPDFIFLRALPLFVRGYSLPIFVRYIADFVLLLSALIFVCSNRGFDDVDDNNLIITLLVCRVYKPTHLSKFALTAYKRLRTYSPEYALTRYHRSESGGNPEIAFLCIDVLHKYS